MKILPQFTTFTDAVNEQQDRALKRSMIEREMAMKAQELDIARQKVASGGDHPAAIKIVNDMQKAAAEANDPNLSSMERARAAHRYSLLNQVSKSYAVDRGMEAVVPGFYGSAEGAPTWQEAVKMPATQAMPVLSAAKAGSVQSDINEAAEIIRNQGGMVDLNSMKMPPPLPSGVAPATGVTAIPGFDAVLANREAAVKQAGKQAEANVELQMKPQITQADSRAKYTEEGYQALPQVQRSLQAAVGRDQMLGEKIRSIRERANGLTTGFGGALFDSIPGSPAYDLKEDVDTLLANAGFDRLQEMRDNSPTGGALGSVTENELRMLQSAAQSLYASQSREQFLRNLESFEAARARAMRNVQAAYEQDYGRFGGASDPYLPPPTNNSHVISWEDLQ